MLRHAISLPRTVLRHRQGSVLVLVLLVLVILTMTTAFFVVSAVEDATSGDLLLKREHQQLARSSACELACHQFEIGHEVLPHELRDGTGETLQLQWSHPVVDARTLHLQPGLLDESSKLNLNVLSFSNEQPLRDRDQLLPLPGMDAALADALLDWLDPDSLPRPLGAEDSYYSAQSAAVLPRNGPLPDLADLLNVRGITPAILWGTAHSPGLANYLTISSREYQPPSRIHLNKTNLVALYDELEREFGPRAAQFVVACRLQRTLEFTAELQRFPHAQQEQLLDVFEAPAETALVIHEPLVRGGLDLDVDTTFRIRSFFDLLGTSVRIRIGVEDLVLNSPWSGDPISCEQSWRDLSQRCVLTDASSLAGRINVNVAPREVLLCLPEFRPELASALVARRRPGRDHSTPVWLYTDGICDLTDLRHYGPYLTAQGSVFTGELTLVPNHRARLSSTILLDASQRPAIWKVTHDAW